MTTPTIPGAEGLTTMKALVQERFGPPETLRLVDAERPEPAAGEVLIEVRAAALNPYDWHMLRGDPLVARLMVGGVGLRRPRSRVAGIDVAGRVVALGEGVHGVAPWDEVFGICPGSFAEYACARADLVVPKPAGLTFEQAAAFPMAAVTALRGIRDVGGVRAGDRVLVNGAGGGVGTFAVQIAAALGAEVTGVCSTGNVELVRSLGARHVIDYTQRDFTRAGVRYDVILDNVGNHPLRRVRRALNPGGVLVLNGGGSPGRVVGAMGPMLSAAVVNVFVCQRLRVLPTAYSREDLLALTDLVEQGGLAPVVDRTYPLADAVEGLRQMETGHTRGKLVLTVA